jgi:6-aminohexanoate-oligomer exohydrolase
MEHIETLPVTSADGSTVPLAAQLERSCCDAICVVHDGAIVYERYFNGMTIETPHLLMSVSKSITAATLGVAIGRGLLAASDLVCDIAPEFAGTSLDGATVQHVVDMAAGTDFVEDYALYDDPDGDSPLLEYERQAGYRPLGARAPIGTLAHFRTYGTAFEHGTRFDYRSPLTNITARILEVVNDLRFPDIVSRDLWGPLGQEHDADIMLDPLGNPVAEGGVSCTARDLARVGLAYLDDGGGVIPAGWVSDTGHGTDHHVVLRRRVRRHGQPLPQRVLGAAARRDVVRPRHLRPVLLRRSALAHRHRPTLHVSVRVADGTERRDRRRFRPDL